MDLILWQDNYLFMVKASTDKTPLFLVPEFCFSPPFFLLNFILSYSTWIIISLLLVFYPHSVDCISSSFVFSFVLIPYNSLAFFSYPTNHHPGCHPCSPAWENCQFWNTFPLSLSVSSSVFCLVMPQVFIIICWLCLPRVFYTVSLFSPLICF